MVVQCARKQVQSARMVMRKGARQRRVVCVKRRVCSARQSGGACAQAVARMRGAGGVAAQIPHDTQFYIKERNKLILINDIPIRGGMERGKRVVIPSFRKIGEEKIEERLMMRQRGFREREETER